MPIIPWRPFWDIEKWFEEEEEFLPLVPAWRIREPRMDIYETEKEVVAEVEVPGIDPNKIEITVKGNLLKIEGGEEKKEEEKKKGYFKKEIKKGYFQRVVSLPTEVIGEKVEATYQDGILKVVLPKAKPEKEKEKKIKIKIKQ